MVLETFPDRGEGDAVAAVHDPGVGGEQGFLHGPETLVPGCGEELAEAEPHFVEGGGFFEVDLA